MHLIKSKEKKERSLQSNLGLKAYRSASPKSGMNKRGTRPGEHGGKFSRNGSEFKTQLMEKQRIKFSYGLSEKQIKTIFKKALASKKSVTNFILRKLETRLDNVTFKLGYAPSRIMARQLISHGHFLVNGRKVNVPSFEVKVGDLITIKEKSQKISLFKEIPTTLKGAPQESWLSRDVAKFEGTMKSVPENIELPFNINLVVDYYSR